MKKWKVGQKKHEKMLPRFCELCDDIFETIYHNVFNPKGGVGPKVPACQEIASQDCAMVTKILDFIHKHLI